MPKPATNKAVLPLADIHGVPAVFNSMTDVGQDPAKVFHLLGEHAHPTFTNPRTLVSEETLQIIADVAENGVQTPILVFRHDGAIHVLDGKTRLAGALLGTGTLSAASVPVEWFEGSLADALAAMLKRNNLRAAFAKDDVASHVLRSYHVVSQEDQDITIEDWCDRCGVKHRAQVDAVVSRHLATSHPVTAAAITDGIITPEAAAAIHRSASGDEATINEAVDAARIAADKAKADAERRMKDQKKGTPPSPDTEARRAGSEAAKAAAREPNQTVAPTPPTRSPDVLPGLRRNAVKLAGSEVEPLILTAALKLLDTAYAIGDADYFSQKENGHANAIPSVPTCFKEAVVADWGDTTEPPLIWFLIGSLLSLTKASNIQLGTSPLNEEYVRSIGEAQTEDKAVFEGHRTKLAHTINAINNIVTDEQRQEFGETSDRTFGELLDWFLTGVGLDDSEEGEEEEGEEEGEEQE